MKEFLKTIGLDTIKDYKFVKQLGGGKASVVCLYENPEGSKQVVKMLIVPRSDVELDSFKSEPGTLAQLNRYDTINIPKVLSKLIQLRDYPIYYYIMEYVDGITLTSYIEKNPLPWDATKALEMIACITSALSKTSAQGIVHRDLHPGNIILRTNFDPNRQYTEIDVDITIMDYGCHKDAFHDLHNHSSDSDYYKKIVYFTKRDYLRHFGAVSTWSPEFLKDPHSVDVSHDIWALGVLLFRFLTNDYPLRAKSFSDLYENLVSTFKVNWILFEKLKIHWAIEALLKRMLSPYPRMRYLHDDIVKICIGLASTTLYKRSDSFIREFLSRDGDCWICPLCFEMVFPSGTRCTACGRMIEYSREWINPFYKIKA